MKERRPFAMLPSMTGDLRDAKLMALQLAIDMVGNAPLRMLKAMLRRADPEEYRRHAELIAWPSHAELIAEARLGKSGVVGARRILVAAGLLTHLPERSIMSGNDAISVYRINRALARGEAMHAAALPEQRRLETARRDQREHKLAQRVAMLVEAIERGDETHAAPPPVAGFAYQTARRRSSGEAPPLAAHDPYA